MTKLEMTLMTGPHQPSTVEAESESVIDRAIADLFWIIRKVDIKGMPRQAQVHQRVFVNLCCRFSEFQKFTRSAFDFRYEETSAP
jgi:hypothetical protein